MTPLASDPGRSSRPARRGRVALVAMFVATLLVAAAVLTLNRGPESVAMDAGAGLRVGAALGDQGRPTTTVPPAITVTPTTQPQLPLPERLPSNPYAPTPEIVLGRLQIPKLGVDEPLQVGMTLTAINRGPSQWPGTALPGSLGNLVIAGHRTTYTKPFSRIDELEAGDRVLIVTDRTTITYEVRGVIVVPAAHIGIAAQSAAHTATLFACHPRGSATERIVAKLRLLDAAGQPVDADDALPPVDQGTDPVSDTTLMVRGDDDPAPPGDPFGAVGG